MQHTRVSCRITAVACLLLTSSAFAQQPATVGELLKKGGKKLSKDEAVAFFASDREIAGTNPRGTRKFHLAYRPDGSISGRSTNLEGNNGYGLMGKWTINDQGQFCTTLQDAEGRDRTPTPRCGFRYNLGTSLYSASSDEPPTPVRQLNIIR